MTSSFWMNTIVAGSVFISLGGIAVTLGNVRYLNARDEENKVVRREEVRLEKIRFAEEIRKNVEAAEEKARKHRERLAKKAMDLLIPELENHLKNVNLVKPMLEQDPPMVMLFAESAWKAVSGSEIVMAMEPEVIGQLLKINHRVAALNDSYAGASLPGLRPTQAKDHIRNYKKNLEKLEPLLKKIINTK